MYSNEPKLYIYLSEGGDAPFCISDTGWILDAAAPMQFPPPLSSAVSYFGAILSLPVLLQALSYSVYGCSSPWLSCFTLVSALSGLYIFSMLLKHLMKDR